MSHLSFIDLTILIFVDTIEECLDLLLVKLIAFISKRFNDEFTRLVKGEISVFSFVIIVPDAVNASVDKLDHEIILGGLLSFTGSGACILGCLFIDGLLLAH